MGNKKRPTGVGSGGGSYGEESRKPSDGDSIQDQLPEKENQENDDQDEGTANKTTTSRSNSKSSDTRGAGVGGAQGSSSGSQTSGSSEEQQEPESTPDESEETSDSAPEGETPDSESEDEEAEQDEEQEQAPDIRIIALTHGWSAASWRDQPKVLKLRERYRHQLDVIVRPLRAVEFADPETEVNRWIAAKGEGNPIDEVVWQRNPPSDNQRSTQALEAAIKQGVGWEYLRLLWIETILNGKNPESEESLFAFAQDFGLDVEQFMHDYDGADTQEPIPASDSNTSPHYVTFADFLPVSENRKFLGEIEEVFALLVGECTPIPPRPVPVLLDVYGPLTTEEVKEIHGWDRTRTVTELATLEEDGQIERIDVRGGTVWRLRTRI